MTTRRKGSEMDQGPTVTRADDPAAPAVVRVSAATAWGAMRTWPARRWLAAVIATGATVLAVGLSTVLIPNPVFGREIAPTGWAWPVLLVTAVLSGLLAATYVRAAPGTAEDLPRAGLLGGLLAYLAVGCPVCNKLALIALGYAGALQWFAPLQPLLAVAAIGLLGYALHRRLVGEQACSVRLP